MNGFSILEVILAIVVFITFSGASVVSLLGGLDLNRLGKEETIAAEFASEGMEAARSIKNQAYTNLLTPNPTPRGVTRNASNVWQFTGDSTSNTFVSGGKTFTRTVKVESVNRDGNGDIVPAGSYDINTKKITSTVTWNFKPVKLNTISLISYLSDGERPITSGILTYGDSVNNPSSPKYRTYIASTDSFSAQSDTFSGALGRSFSLRTSPLREEAIAGYVTSSGLMQIYCYDGIVWYQEWTATVGGNGSTRRFDIGYETNSGDALVVYSRDTTSNEIGYRTKSGSLGCGSLNWSGETALDSRDTNGRVHWVKIATDRRTNSNVLFAAWADANSVLQGAFWDGSSWGAQFVNGLEGSLQYISTAQDVDSFDIEFESLSGDFMVIFSSGNQRPQYRSCLGAPPCTWSNDILMPTFTDDPTNMDLSANPNTDEMVFASIGIGQSDLQVGYWSGTDWTNSANTDQSAQTPVPGSHLVTTGWLTSGATKRAIVVYGNSGANSNRVNFRFLNPPNSWTPSNGNEPSSPTTLFTPSPLFAATQRWYEIVVDPKNQDQLMLVVSDVSGGNNRLFAKKLTMTSTPTFTWTNADGGAALEQNLGQAIASPFGYAYWIKP